jgi:hypothetical protein
MAEFYQEFPNFDTAPTTPVDEEETVQQELGTEPISEARTAQQTEESPIFKGQIPPGFEEEIENWEEYLNDEVFQAQLDQMIPTDDSQNILEASVHHGGTSQQTWKPPVFPVEIDQQAWGTLIFDAETVEQTLATATHEQLTAPQPWIPHINQNAAAQQILTSTTPIPQSKPAKQSKRKHRDEDESARQISASAEPKSAPRPKKPRINQRGLTKQTSATATPTQERERAVHPWTQMTGQVITAQQASGIPLPWTETVQYQGGLTQQILQSGTPILYSQSLPAPLRRRRHSPGDGLYQRIPASVQSTPQGGPAKRSKRKRDQDESAQQISTTQSKKPRIPQGGLDEQPLATAVPIQEQETTAYPWTQSTEQFIAARQASGTPIHEAATDEQTLATATPIHGRVTASQPSVSPIHQDEAAQQALSTAIREVEPVQQTLRIVSTSKFLST